MSERKFERYQSGKYGLELEKNEWTELEMELEKNELDKLWKAFKTWKKSFSSNQCIFGGPHARTHACTNTHTPPPHLLILSTFVVPLPNYPLLPQLFRTEEYFKLFTGILTVVNRTLIIVQKTKSYIPQKYQNLIFVITMMPTF